MNKSVMTYLPLKLNRLRTTAPAIKQHIHKLCVNACSNKGNSLSNIIQHCWNATLWSNIIQHCWNATCWPRLNTMLDDVGLSLNLLKIFVQHHTTLLGQQSSTKMASFVPALRRLVMIKFLHCNKTACNKVVVNIYCSQVVRFLPF